VPVGNCGLGLWRFVSAGVVLGRTPSTCQRLSAATVSRHASAQVVSSTPTPEAALPVHAAQTWIDSASILRNMASGSGISACTAPSTAQLTAWGLIEGGTRRPRNES
jgi:hypothetical protein